MSNLGMDKLCSNVASCLLIEENLEGRLGFHRRRSFKYFKIGVLSNFGMGFLVCCNLDLATREATSKKSPQFGQLPP